MNDDTIGHPNRSAAELEAALLDLLGNGPLFKWQLRELLHEPATYILRHLQRLKRAGRVKVVGSILDQRRWALATWINPGVPQLKPTHVRVTKRSTLRQKHERPAVATVPADQRSSWWVGLSRADLAAMARRRQGAMSSAKEAKFVNPGISGQWNVRG